MKYMGSKRSIAKYILPIILKDRKSTQWYIEPFVGGANTIDKVNTDYTIGNDNNFFLISMFNALQNGWVPPEYVSIDEYNSIKNNKMLYKPELVGYVGFNTYGSKWFGGYCRDKKGKRDHWREHFNNIMKQVPHLSNIIFTCSEYYDVPLFNKSIVYCDPPYKDTTQYNSTIDYEFLYIWLRSLRADGHTVFLSEFSAPEDFVCVWEKQRATSLTQNTFSRTGVEKLFKIV